MPAASLLPLPAVVRRKEPSLFGVVAVAVPASLLAACLACRLAVDFDGDSSGAVWQRAIGGVSLRCVSAPSLTVRHVMAALRCRWAEDATR